MPDSTSAAPPMVSPPLAAGDPPPRRGVRSVWGKLHRFGPLDWIGLAVVVLMVGLIAYPFARSLVRVLFVDGSFNSAAFDRVLTSSVFWDAAKTTAIILVIAVPLAIVVSGVFAWLTERTNARMGAVATVLPILPMLIPGIAMSIGWKFLADQQVGFLNVFVLRPLLGLFGMQVDRGPLNINSWYGVIFVYTIELIPFAYLILSAALRDLNSSFEEASRTSGAGALRTMWKVSLPSMRPALLGATLLCFMIGAGIFTVPVILGTADINTLSVFIVNSVRQNYPPQFDTALVGSIFLGLFAATLWLLEGRVRRRSRYAQIGGKSQTRNPVNLGAWRPVARAAMILFVVVVSVLPMLGLLYVALQPYWTATLSMDFTLANFRSVFDTPQLTLALRTSVFLALGGATIGVGLAALSSAFMERHRRLSSTVDGVWKSPGALTHVAIGVGFIIGLGGPPLNLAGSWQILLLAYLVLFSPQAIIAVGGAYDRLGGELSEASAANGASPLRTFVRVSLPLMRPGLAAGWTLLFVHMFSEVTASAVLASPNHPVVGSVILDVFGTGLYGQLAALALLVALVNVVFATTILLRGHGATAGARSRRRPAWARKWVFQSAEIPTRSVDA